MSGHSSRSEGPVVLVAALKVRYALVRNASFWYIVSSDMAPAHPISISVLHQALEGKRAEKRILEADIDELERAIRQLKGTCTEMGQFSASATPMMDGDAVARIIRFQERAVEDNEAYPAAKFQGMSRIEIAIALAQDFDGYLAPRALRKVLSKPGVLTSTKQVASVASRVLMHSDQFRRCWEGLYQLKNYQPNKISCTGESATGAGR
jgi:hypothetical protein